MGAVGRAGASCDAQAPSPMQAWLARSQRAGSAPTAPCTHTLHCSSDAAYYLPACLAQVQQDPVLPLPLCPPARPPAAPSHPPPARRYRNAELQNGRWAMLGVVGILFPAELTRQGLLNVPAWYDAGKVYAESENAIPFGSLLMVQFFLFNFVEIKRWEDIKKPGSQAEPGSFLVSPALLPGGQASGRAAMHGSGRSVCGLHCSRSVACLLAMWEPQWLERSLACLLGWLADWLTGVLRCLLPGHPAGLRELLQGHWR